MLYENYYKKVSIIARILNQIRRFRAWFIGFGIGIVVAFCIFIALQGLVYDKAPCPDEIVYGDALTYEAKALFREVEYEFSESGNFDDGKAEQPKMPGIYKVRAVARSFFGTMRHGKTYTFHILQRNIDVSAYERLIVYGETPTAYAELVYDDSIKCEQYSYDDISLEYTKIMPISESVKILNKDGDDVTNAYVINPVKTDIQLTPRDITVTVENATNVYNALPFTYEGNGLYEGYGVTGGSVASWGISRDDEVLATFDASLIDVGMVENIPTSLRVLHPDGKEVTRHYNISVVNGMLEVATRPVIVQFMTGDDVIEYTYDAEEHFFTEYIIDPSTPLVDGHSQELNNFTRITDAGEAPNLLSLKFFDEKGKDVTHNHYCMFVPNNLLLKVNPRPITLEAGDDEKIYDGTALSNSDWELLPATPGKAEGLLVKHSIDSLITEGEQVEVGVTPNNIVESSIKIIDKASRKNVTANYKFELLPGELTITPRDIMITTNTSDETFIYDGTAQAYPYFTVDSGVSIHTIVPVEDTLTRVKNVIETSDPENPIENIFEVQIFDQANEDVTENYVITYEYGTLTLLQRPLEIKAVDRIKVYDALPLISSDWEAPNLVSELHEIELTTETRLPEDAEGELVNVGTAENLITSYRIVEIEEIDGVKEDVTDNYDVTTVDGTLEITKRPVTVTADSDYKIYDAIPIVAEGWDFETENTETSSGLLQEIHVISDIEVLGGNTADVGTYDNIITPGSVRIAEKEDTSVDVTENYEIILENGELIIDPRPIKIQTADDEWTYDGDVHFNESWTYRDDSEYEVVEGQTVEIENRTEVIKFVDGGTPNEFDLVIKDNGIDVTHNYDIDYVYGTLTINKREVNIDTVGTLENEWIYDGKAHSKKEWKYHEGNALGFVEGQTVEVTAATEMINYKETGTDNELVLQVFNVTENVTENVTDNYIINILEKGKLFINQREIKIITKGNTWTYDGEAHFNAVWDYQPENENEKLYKIVEGQTSNVVSYSIITNFTEGGIDNELKLQILDGTVDVTYNYIVNTVKKEKLVIEKRSITILTNSHTWIYNAQEYFDYGWMYAPGSLFEAVYGDNVKHKIVVDESTVTKIINVVRDSDNNVLSIENKFVVGVFDEDTETEVTSNYDINYEYGWLKVTPRRLTVQTPYHMWKYDAQWHFDANFTILEEIAEDYGLVDEQTGIVDETTITKILNVIRNGDEIDGIDNEFVIKIFSGNEPVSDNYDITYIYGILFVVEDIKVTTQEAEKVYDGTELINHTYFTSILPADCQFEDIEVTGTQTVVGESDNTVDSDKVWISYTDEFGKKHVVACEIEFEYGILKVTKRKMIVNTHSGQWVYDGEEHEVPEWSYHEDTPYEIADGQTGIIDETTITKILNVIRNGGEIDGIDNEFVIKIFSGNEDVSDNYDIEYRCGELRLTPRPLNIKTEYKEKVYDDKKPEWYEFVIITDKEGDSDSETGLLRKHSVQRWEINKDIIDVNVGLYTVAIVDGTVVIVENGSGIDMTGNYEITYDTDELKITPRPVTIQTNYHMWKYDGTAHFDTDYTVEPGIGADYGFVAGHRVEVIESSITKIVNIGRVDNKFAVAVFNSNGEVTSNYAIEYIYGILFVTEEIKVTTGGGEKQYDGNPLRNPNYTVSELPFGCKFEDIEVTGSQTDATDNLETEDIKEGVDNTVDTDKIWVSYGSHKVLCDIDYDLGSLVVTHRELTIKTGSQKWLWDGMGHTNKQYEILEGELVVGQRIQVIRSTVITEAGKLPNEFREIEILTPAEENVVHNYVITYELGELEITKKNRVITIRLYNVTKQYDGKPLVFDETCYEIVDKDDALVFQFNDSTSITLPGTITPEDIAALNLGYSVTYDGDDVSFQCTIEFVPGVGSLNVTRREITLKAADAIKEFDGSPLVNENVIVSEGSIAEGQTLYAKAIGENLDQPVVENVVDRANVKITYVNDKGKVIDVTDCYDIKYQNGTLTLKFPS